MTLGIEERRAAIEQVAHRWLLWGYCCSLHANDGVGVDGGLHRLADQFVRAGGRVLVAFWAAASQYVSVPAGWRCRADRFVEVEDAGDGERSQLARL